MYFQAPQPLQEVLLTKLQKFCRLYFCAILLFNLYQPFFNSVGVATVIARGLFHPYFF